MKNIHTTNTTNLEVFNSKIEGRTNDIIIVKTTVMVGAVGGGDKPAIVNAITLTPIEQRMLFNELKHLLT